MSGMSQGNARVVKTVAALAMADALASCQKDSSIDPKDTVVGGSPPHRLDW